MCRVENRNGDDENGDGVHSGTDDVRRRRENAAAAREQREDRCGLIAANGAEAGRLPARRLVRLAAMHRALGARFDLAVAEQFARSGRFGLVQQDRRRCQDRDLTGQKRRGENDEATAKGVH